MTQVRWWTVSVFALTLLLAGVPVSAQESDAAASEIDEQAMSSLKRMAEFLAQSQSLSARLEIGFDVVQDSGQKIEFGETRELVLKRPDRIRIDSTKRDGSQTRFSFDGQHIAVFNARENVYASVAKPGTLDEAIDYFVNDLDMRLPLAELFSTTFPQIVENH